MVPRFAMVWDSSLISSSSIIDSILADCSGAKDIIMIAAFCGPVRLR